MKKGVAVARIFPSYSFSSIEKKKQKTNEHMSIENYLKAIRSM